MVFRNQVALQDFAKKNNMEVQYHLDTCPEPEIAPEEPSEVKPTLKTILSVFENGAQVLVVRCIDKSKKPLLAYWTEEDEWCERWELHIKRLKDHYQFQPEILAIIEKLENAYEGGE